MALYVKPDNAAADASAATAPAQPAENGQQDARGRFLPGNALAKRHGLHASRSAEAMASAREQFLASDMADAGGLGDVPTRKASLHHYRARLHSHISALSDALETFGLFDKRGRLRVAWLQRLEGLMTTAHRLDATLGLERRARPVDPLEAVRRAVAAANDKGAE